MKHNALELRWEWYEERENTWHPSATEAVKDFILWLYWNDNTIMGHKNYPKRRNDAVR